MKKIKNAVVVVIFLSAFLCACHENYANASSGTETSSEYTPVSVSETA